MCVNSSITLMVRALINDLDAETYTDERLEQLIVVAAKFVNQDLESSYVIDINSPDIVPDPVDQDDEIFVNLVSVKSACMIDHGNLRLKAAVAGLSATAGPASLSIGSNNFGAYKDIIAMGPCAMYRIMLQDYKFGAGALCHGILSPFISNSFDPSNLNYGYDRRDI